MPADASWPRRLWNYARSILRRRQVGKIDIVHHLIDRFGYRRYLEIATSTTGFAYGSLDRNRVDVSQRVMYNLPVHFSDGLPVDYAFESLDITPALALLAARRPRFDIIFVDPHHGYEPSWRDIAAAFDLLAPGGAMVVHDCQPPDETMAQPDYRDGGWCGVTYKAYLDFVLGRDDLRYRTVAADFGCGVIFKPPWPSRSCEGDAAERRSSPEQVNAWRSFGHDYALAWRYFEANAATLLHLVTVKQFLSDC